MRPAFIFGPRWIGSFQDQRTRIATETPLDEAWMLIGRHATDLHLQKTKPDNPAVDWAMHVNYTRARIQQALEFRAAAHSATILTAPLPLYYAFLNLMRGYMALVPEIIPAPKHGLHFESSADVLSCAAALDRTGTFADYLTAAKISWKPGDRITLRDVLGSIIDMKWDIESLGIADSHAQEVGVDSRQGGSTILQFPGYPRQFSTDWKSDFPILVGDCQPTGNDCELEVNQAASGQTYESIGTFLATHLINDLLFREWPLWWALRMSESFPKWDQAAYYHAGCFILGSAVRYEPETMLTISRSDSGVGWVLKRFLGRAERFYPQLLLSRLWATQVYFSSA